MCVTGGGRLHLVMEIYRSPAGHFSGRILPENGRAALPFSGILDLVGVLEALEPEEPPPGARPERDHGEADGA